LNDTLYHMTDWWQGVRLQTTWVGNKPYAAISLTQI
jgi:hypothetical protein